MRAPGEPRTVELTDHDAAELAMFAGFLRRVGPHREITAATRTPEGWERLRAWVAEAPEERARYLGMPEEWGRELVAAKERSEE